ncbi:TRAP transporter large permease protein OS=Castellaniella defragrans OX=75697 GN=HNR28_001725 PE=3 SV=1 [Castellaniella defragrans]
MIIGYLGIVFLLLSIVAGLNIFVALGFIGTLGLISLHGLDAGLSTISATFFATADSFSFSVIPMFLLMGYFAISAGLGEDLFKSASAWMGGLRGGLSIAATAGAAVFGAASGSSIGTAMVFTKLALPPMLSRGYDKRLAAGSIAIAGTLAVMIPPSALMVVYGILTQASIGKLLIAGILPGIVFACILLITTMIIIRRHPELVPDPEPRVPLRGKIASLKYAAPLILLVILIILGMYEGVFTPTEAGGFGAFVTFIMAVIRRRGIGESICPRCSSIPPPPPR